LHFSTSHSQDEKRQSALHKAPTGSAGRRTTNGKAARACTVAEAGIGGPRDLRPLDLACRVFAVVQLYGESRPVRLGQSGPMSYVDR
jgi:hypothetical protein